MPAATCLTSGFAAQRRMSATISTITPRIKCKSLSTIFICASVHPKNSTFFQLYFIIKVLKNNKDTITLLLSIGIA
jgi:hypothetical protein